MTRKQIEETAQDYLSQVELMNKICEEIEEKIEELKDKYRSVANQNIYMKLYKSEFGEYRDYVEAVALELRNKNNGNKDKISTSPNNHVA